MKELESTRKFLARVASPEGFEVLFDHLPDVYFFVKDEEGRFVRFNQAFLKLVQAEAEEDVLGARDFDFFPTSLAENYVRDDREVIRSSQAIIDKAELVRTSDGNTDWFCTTKLPVLDSQGRPIGVCGITRDVKRMNATNARFLSWAPVVEAMLNDFARPLETATLAQKVALSVSQFNRQFRKRFHTTPRTYLAGIRMNAACHLLITTDLSMSEIALKTGFYDQSHFTNQFVKRYGVPPSKYRVLHAQSLAPRTESADQLATRLLFGSSPDAATPHEPRGSSGPNTDSAAPRAARVISKPVRAGSNPQERLAPEQSAPGSRPSSN